MRREVYKEWSYGIMELIEATRYAWSNKLTLVIFEEYDMNCLTIGVDDYSKADIQRAYLLGCDIADSREFGTKESYYSYIAKNIAGVRCLGGIM